MALKIVKLVPPQAVTEPVTQIVPVETVPEVAPSIVEGLTAEYIDLYEKFVYFEVKPLVARMEELRKHLQSIANETVDKNQPAIFTCEKGEVEFSERSKMAVVADPLALMAVVLDKFGPEVAQSVVKIGMTELRKVLSEAELLAYVKDEPGSRTLKSVRPSHG